MDKIELKYRKWYKGIPPRPIKLQIPGWAGDSHGHDDGDKPQPWHCPPFVDGSTYGLELIYPFETECRVKNIDGRAIFEGRWEDEPSPDGTTFPPFLQFAPGHYGFTSSLDIKCPPDYVIRIEPHPRFYTDTTGTVPVTVCGHIQGDWWPKVFFVVFRSPRPGETHIFRKGEPYAQILVVPRRVLYSVKEMDHAEMAKRNVRDGRIAKYGKVIAKNAWSDHKSQGFDDKYKVLSSIYAKGGEAAVDRYLEEVEKEEEQRRLDQSAQVRQKMPRTLVRKK
jgi:hypothetical protein